MKSVLLLVASVLSGFHYALAGNPQELEQQVKAVCMYNFAKFVDWPAEVFTPQAKVMNICVLGEAPLANILEGKKDLEAKGKAIRVKRFHANASQSDAQSCQLLYWDSKKTTPKKEVLQLLDSHPILSVSEDDENNSHAIVHFRIINDRVKFSIDHEKAKRVGLSLSPQLLRLAVK